MKKLLVVLVGGSGEFNGFNFFMPSAEDGGVGHICFSRDGAWSNVTKLTFDLL